VFGFNFRRSGKSQNTHSFKVPLPRTPSSARINIPTKPSIVNLPPKSAAASSVSENASNLFSFLLNFAADSIAPSTRRSYKAGQNCFSSFLSKYEFPSSTLLSETIISLFICFMFQKGLAYSTAAVYLDGVRSFYLENFRLQWWNLNSPLVSRILSGYKRLLPKSLRTDRHPLMFDDILDISAMLNLSEFNDLAFLTILLILFFGCFRSCEIIQTRDYHGLRLSDLQFLPSIFEATSVKIHIAKDKTHNYLQSVEIKKLSDTSLCPVLFLILYLSKRNPVLNDDSVFVWENSKPIDYITMLNKLKEVWKALGRNPDEIALHCPRIGSSTQAIEQGIPDTLVQARGRWAPNSLCYKKYIRSTSNTPSMLAQVLGKRTRE
jgi:hypothetical protein